MRMKCLGWARLILAKKGNVSITFAFAVIPVLLGLGMSIDYGMAAKRHAKMNAAADAAALSAITPAMMAQSTTAAQAQATAIFNSEVGGMAGVSYTPANLTVSVSEMPVNNSRQRKVTVAYSAASANAFGGILKMASIEISGSSQASAKAAANIDFYLMLDTSPSMGIAATQDGINAMVMHTASQGGCAFACHEYNPSADNLGNPGGEDNYQLAQNLGVKLRIDLVTEAVQNLMTTASADETAYNAVYRMAGYTFDIGVNNVIPLTSSLSTAQTEASNISMLEVWDNNNLTYTNSNNDEDTDFDSAFQVLNSAIPNPGNGSNAPGDTPQKVLLLVTDGVADENSSGRIYTPFGANTSWCQTIKNRGIRIAVLYTTYYPLPTNGWYNTYIAPEQASITTTAQACASPNLFFQVDTGGDISSAMQTLFTTAVATSHLTE